MGEAEAQTDRSGSVGGRMASGKEMCVELPPDVFLLCSHVFIDWTHFG